MKSADRTRKNFNKHSQLWKTESLMAYFDAVQICGWLA